MRHRGKIESVVNNAKRAIDLIEEWASLASFLWQFEPSKTTVLRRRDQIVPKTAESTALSKDLKQRGWTFVGPTTCYAMMQAVGMVNDHLKGCGAWNVDHGTESVRATGLNRIARLLADRVESSHSHFALRRRVRPFLLHRLDWPERR